MWQYQACRYFQRLIYSCYHEYKYTLNPDICCIVFSFISITLSWITICLFSFVGLFSTWVHLFRRYPGIVSRKNNFFHFDSTVGDTLPSQTCIFIQCSPATAWISEWRLQPSSLNADIVITITSFNIYTIETHPFIPMSYYPKISPFPKFLFSLPLPKQSFPRRSFRDVTHGVCKPERRAP